MSNLSVGIVGLPNVGKSTLFNALLGRQIADASNYPFCTIEPNVGIVEVPDLYLPQIAKIAGSKKTVPAVVKFVDVAGLVEGAAKGEGLGNKFLSHLRSVDALCHVVRNFTDSNVALAGSTDPQSDFDLICTELILKDLETLDGNKTAIALKLKKELEKGKLAINLDLDPEEKKLAKEFFLLTAKPFLLVINLDENAFKNLDRQVIKGRETVPICAKLEEELTDFSPKDRRAYLKELGLKKSGLERLINQAYDTLKLQSFYSANRKEAHAWTIPQNSTAYEAAGVVHTDFQKGFIGADCLNVKDFINQKGWQGARTKGLVRQEGREYKVQNQDVIDFKFNL